MHRMLLTDHGIYAVENANLEPPLEIQGASGSPLRAIALAP